MDKAKRGTSSMSGVNAKPGVNGEVNNALRKRQQEEQTQVELQKLAEADGPHNTATAPARKSILEQAYAAVNGERQENYGSQYKNFTNIADIWTVILREKLIAPITPQDVAMCQIALKLARLTKTGGLHRDSIVDIAGYAECLDVINLDN